MIRVLGAADAAAYHALRLRAVREAPLAFFATHDEEVARPLAEVAAMLARRDDPVDGVLGVHHDGTLVGTLGITREHRSKLAHRALIWGVYVVPEARARGLASALLADALARLAARDDLEQVELTVGAGTPAARRLYERAGFRLTGIQPRALRLDGTCYDELELVKRLRGPTAPIADAALGALLADRSPSEATPLLLAAAAAQAARKRPTEIVAQLARDPFVAPSMLDGRVAHALDGLALAAAPAFEAVVLAPLAPLGVCTSVAPQSQHRIVSTTRGTEVVSDPTNVLAAIAAARLRNAPRGAVALCTVHQVTRAQQLAAKPGHAQHFRMFALASAGAGRADHGFEVDAILEHLAVIARVLDAWGGVAARRATVLASPAGQPVADRIVPRLAAVSGLAVDVRPLESTYYAGIRVLLGADTAAGHVNLSDTGAFDWVAQLTSDRRMRLVASGLGLQLLPILFPRA